MESKSGKKVPRLVPGGERDYLLRATQLLPTFNSGVPSLNQEVRIHRHYQDHPLSQKGNNGVASNIVVKPKEGLLASFKNPEYFAVLFCKH